MNKQCIQCGHVMLVPDIPLPAGYTQKCIACGRVNNVSDQYDQDDSIPPSFDSSMDATDIIDFSGANDVSNIANDVSNSQFDFSAPVNQASSSNLEDQIRQLKRQVAGLQESMLRGPQNSTNRVGQAEVIASQEASSALNHHPLLNSPVATNHAIFCSQQAAMANICARQLREKGIVTETVADLDAARTKVASHAFQFIIVDQRLIQGKPQGQPFLKLINSITIPVRRQQVIALLTPNIETCESQVFYQWGFDINVHFDDLEGLSDVLLETLDEKMQLYSEFKGLAID